MPEDRPLSRRDAIGFGLAGLTLSRPEVLAALQHARDAVQSPPAKLEALDAPMADEIEAIAARIIPSDSTPGAREAGVIYFIDRALATFDRDKLALYREGLARLQALRLAKHASSTGFHTLPPAAQDELLTAIEKSGFFEAVRVHTITGFLAHPSWRGNRGRAGWSVIGFEDRHSFDPPFGYYDDPARSGQA
jgi:gluconate 2-dehydrogenase gamma chain